VREQTDIFDFIEEPKTKDEIKDIAWAQTRLKIEEWLKDKKPEMKMFFKIKSYSYIYMGFDKAKEKLLNVFETKSYHFANMPKEIYFYSLKDEGVYYRFYQVKNRILAENTSVIKFTDNVRFAAMTIQMFDSKGEDIHFSNRESFIMKDLDFENIKDSKEFYNTEIKYTDLIKHLK